MIKIANQYKDKLGEKMTKSVNAKEILRQFTREVWSEGNIEASDKYIAPKYKIHHDPGDPWEGRILDLAGYKERVKALRAAFPDQRFDIQELFEDGEAVVMTWLWYATHKGDIAGFPATGKKIKMSGATVYYFEGSQLTGHWQITDRLGVYRQLRQASSGT
jgi:steroid delta-isomerase-like uncharacterized protein